MVRRHWIAVAVSGLVVAGALSFGAGHSLAGQTNNRGATVGIVGGSNAPAASGTHFFTLAGSAFAPDGLHNTAEDYFNQWDPSGLSSQDSGRCFDAAVDLPNGAKISTVTVYYIAGSNAMYFELNRQELSTHTATILASVDTPINTGTPIYTTTVIHVTANNTVTTKDAYSIGVCPSATTAFSGATIAYTG